MQTIYQSIKSTVCFICAFRAIQVSLNYGYGPLGAAIPLPDPGAGPRAPVRSLDTSLEGRSCVVIVVIIYNVISTRYIYIYIYIYTHICAHTHISYCWLCVCLY